MKKLKKLLSEVKGEHAHKEAIAMGLKYKGFGFWADPETGETKYKTENDTLQPVVPDEESELYKGGPGDEGGNDMMGQGGMPGQGGMMGANGMLQMPGQDPMQQLGANLGDAPEAGTEQAPSSQPWKPGPDGDTCVGQEAQPPGVIPSDGYVGKTNYAKWTAGPDGDNMNTVDADTVTEETTAPGTNTLFGNSGKSLKSFPDIRMNNNSFLTGNKDGDTHASVLRDLLASVEGRNEGKEKMRYKTGRDTVVGRLKGEKTRPVGPGRSRELEAGRVFDKLSPDDKEKELERVQDAGATRHMPKDAGEGTKAHFLRREVKGIPARGKDKERASHMNEELRNSGILSDPDFPLDFNEENYIGEGQFGQVSVSDDGESVIKRGSIGPEELKVLHALRDVDGIPNLINAEFTAPFADESAMENNPGGYNTREPGQSKYFDKEDQSYLDRRFPTAQGQFAMSTVPGEELFDAQQWFDDDETANVQEQIWNLRRQMHELGVSHNDMHGGNIKYDEDTGKVSLIDFGLAQDDPMSALREAFGGYTGEDSQLAGTMAFDELMNDRIRQRIEDNRNGIFDELRDTYQERIMDPDDFDMDEEQIMSLLEGGIRGVPSEHHALAEAFGWMEDDSENEGQRRYSQDGRNAMRNIISKFYAGTEEPWGQWDGEDTEEPLEKPSFTPNTSMRKPIRSLLDHDD